MKIALLQILPTGSLDGNREKGVEACRRAKALGAEVYMPPLKLCGDNGAMIGSQGYYEYLAGTRAGQELNAFATRPISMDYSE